MNETRAVFNFSPLPRCRSTPQKDCPARPNEQNELRLFLFCETKARPKAKRTNATQKVKGINQVKTMSSLSTMSAQEISDLLDEYGIKHGPVVGE